MAPSGPIPDGAKKKQRELTMSITTATAIQANKSLIQNRPLLSFFTLAIVITWLISLPSLLFEMPFKPFQTFGAY
jgi:hypothetical protein